MKTKSFFLSVILAANAFLSGCGQEDSECVDGKRPDGTPCSQSDSQSTGSGATPSSSVRPSDSAKSGHSPDTETGKTVGGFGDSHAGAGGGS